MRMFRSVPSRSKKSGFALFSIISKLPLRKDQTVFNMNVEEEQEEISDKIVFETVQIDRNNHRPDSIHFRLAYCMQ